MKRALFELAGALLLVTACGSSTQSTAPTNGGGGSNTGGGSTSGGSSAGAQGDAVRACNLVTQSEADTILGSPTHRTVATNSSQAPAAGQTGPTVNVSECTYVTTPPDANTAPGLVDVNVFDPTTLDTFDGQRQTHSLAVSASGVADAAYYDQSSIAFLKGTTEVVIAIQPTTIPESTYKQVAVTAAGRL